MLFQLISTMECHVHCLRDLFVVVIIVNCYHQSTDGKKRYNFEFYWSFMSIKCWNKLRSCYYVCCRVDTWCVIEGQVVLHAYMCVLSKDFTVAKSSRWGSIVPWNVIWKQEALHNLKQCTVFLKVIIVCECLQRSYNKCMKQNIIRLSNIHENP